MADYSNSDSNMNDSNNNKNNANQNIKTESNTGENLTNFKGIYFNDHSEKKYYEYGSHFSYKDLCLRLDKLSLILEPEKFNISDNIKKIATKLINSNKPIPYKVHKLSNKYIIIEQR